MKAFTRFEIATIITMPKSLPTTLKEFRVRVDGDDDGRVTEFCKKFCDKYLLVHHVTVTENPHYHVYAKTRYTQGNFANKIKSELGVSKGDYSCKACDTDRKHEYLSYLFNTKKGNKPRTVSYQGFTPFDVEIIQGQAKAVAQEFETKLRSSKKTQYDVAMIVLERVPERASIDKIYDETISVLKAARMMARPNHIKDIIATVMAYSADKKANNDVRYATLRFFGCLN